MACPVCGSPAQPDDTTCKTCGAPLTPAATVALPPGHVLHGGQYVIGRVLGRGGFGITYEAQDQQLGLRVAIKELFVDGSSRSTLRVLPPGNLNAQEFQDTKKRFLDEAKVLARFNHPGIVRVLSYFEENNTAYLVMEFLEGRTVGGEIEKQGRLPPPLVQEIARSVAQTLEHIHGAGLLHRDIKPDNIYLTRTGRVVLIDFGSVRAYAPGKTMSYTRLVTPGYAPLEQYGNAAKFGPYTDIYSLGATLHHALTGQMPPPATDLMLGTPLPPLPPGTPAPLERAIRKAMALRVEDRPQSAHDLLAMLEPPPEAPATRPPQVQAAPATPQPQRSAPAAPQPAPRPQPQPAPAPAPTPKPQPTPPPPRPTAPAPAPRPAPVPVPPPAPAPTPAPVPPPPAPAGSAVKRRAPFTRTLVLALSVGLGGALGLAQLPTLLPELQPLGVAGLGLSVGAGALFGFLIGWLLWFTLPAALPLGMAALAVLYGQQAAWHWPTVGASAVMLAILSLFFLRLIRRIHF